MELTGVPDLYSPRQVRPLARLMRGFDIVHTHLFPAQLWGALGGWRCGRTRLLTTEHGTPHFRRRFWFRPLDAWMYSRYEMIACISEATAESLTGWCPGTVTKIRVIHNGIPLERFAGASPVRLEKSAPGRLRLVFVGRMEVQKDHATLLRAVAQVPDVQLLLVGNGPLRPQLEELAGDLGIAERVIFLGHRADVPEVLKACDVYVHSTNADGFGIAACEAMAAGLPVIASNVPGLAQVVEGAAILFPRGDHEALAAELRLLVASPDRRNQMRAAGLVRAQCFSIEKTVDDYLEMYRAALLGQSNSAFRS